MYLLIYLYVTLIYINLITLFYIYFYSFIFILLDPWKAQGAYEIMSVHCLSVSSLFHPWYQKIGGTRCLVKLWFAKILGKKGTKWPQSEGGRILGKVIVKCNSVFAACVCSKRTVYWALSQNALNQSYSKIFWVSNIFWSNSQFSNI